VLTVAMFVNFLHLFLSIIPLQCLELRQGFVPRQPALCSRMTTSIYSRLCSLTLAKRAHMQSLPLDLPRDFEFDLLIGTPKSTNGLHFTPASPADGGLDLFLSAFMLAVRLGHLKVAQPFGPICLAAEFN
jgi:hypothetical protein